MPRPTRKQRLAEATPIRLDDWIREIRTAHSASGQERGACLVKNPQTGQSYCVQTTKSGCKALKGFWAGGPCGGG